MLAVCGPHQSIVRFDEIELLDPEEFFQATLAQLVEAPVSKAGQSEFESQERYSKDYAK